MVHIKLIGKQHKFQMLTFSPSLPSLGGNWMLASRKIVGRGFSDWVPWKIGAEQRFGRDAFFGRDTETHDCKI